MIVELRQKSQVTIPSELIKQLSLNTGDKFEVVIKDGVLMFIPVTVYPKSYVESLETELFDLKNKIKSNSIPVFQDLDEMFSSLDKE